MNRLLLTKKEAAEAIAVSERTLERLIQAGEIPTVRINGAGFRAIVRIHRADLERWAESLTTIVPAAPGTTAADRLLAQLAANERNNRRPVRA